jgi:ATP-binding cassette subfamily B protein
MPRVRFRLLRVFERVDAGALRRSFSLFAPVLADQRAAIVGASALSLAVAACEVFRPWPMKWVVDRIVAGAGGAAPAPPFGLAETALVPAACAAVLVASLLLGRLSVAFAAVSAVIGRKAAVRVRRRVFERLLRLGPEFHAAHKSGDLLTRLGGDANLVRDLLLTSWLNLLGRGAVFLGSAAAMIALDPWLGLAALAPFPLAGLGIRFGSRRLAAVVRKQRKLEGDAMSSAAEALRHVRTVAAFGAVERVVRAFAHDSRSSERAGATAARTAAETGAFAEFAAGAGLAALLFLGAARTASGEISAGGLVLLLAYARSLYKPLRGLAKEGARLAKAVASAERLAAVLAAPVPDPTLGAPAPPFRGETVFENVVVTYPGGRRALDGADFRIPAGSLAVFAGPNGAGKTTAIHALLRLLVPSSGRVLIDGRDVAEFALDAYRARLAFVPQEIALFGATVRENVSFGRPEADDDAIRAALDAALCSEFVARAGGLEAVLGEGGATLSGGEARRLMLARAALRDARVLVLDEPFAGLDPEAAAAVARAIRRLAAGRTAIVVTHVAVELAAPDVVIAFADGKTAQTPFRGEGVA